MMMSFVSIRSSLQLTLFAIVFVLASSRQGDESGKQTFSVDSLLPLSSCSSTKKAINRKSTLSVIPRDGPCNQHSSGEEVQDLAQLLDLDNQRVASIQSRISRGKDHEKSSVSESLRLPLLSRQSIGGGHYGVTIGLGTPKKELSLIFDTGSDFTWTQCLPCEVNCYEQVNPVFEPSQSSSYKDVLYQSRTCSQMASGTSVIPGSDGSKCLYGMKYADGSFTHGYLATEKLTLSPTEEIYNFNFGCGQNNQGSFGKSDGMLGLGRDRISLVGQTAAKYGRYFSYCLPKTASATGYLSLGKNRASSAVFTPMLSLSDPSLYGISITGILVGEKQVSISPTILLKAGTVIDSGTMITRLPKTAYIALRDAFRHSMREYPPAPPFSIFDTCFNFSGYKISTLPLIQFIFRGGVRLTMGPHNTYSIISLTQVCLAFAGNDDDDEVSIFGSRQQLTFEVIYDNAGRRIGFVPDGC